MPDEAGQHVSKAENRAAIFRVAGFDATEGFKIALERLKANAIPVKLGENVELLVTLEGEEAEEVLESFGLLPEE